MVVGVAQLELILAGSASLKDKRRVVRSVRDRVRRRFNVSVAEVGSQDSWQVVILGVACVSNDARRADSVLQKVIRFIDRERLDAELGDYAIDII